MKAVVLLVVLAFSCGAAAQKPKPTPEPEDVSQKIQGTVTIRNSDGSARPAPFVQVYIYESLGDTPADPIGAWHALKSKTPREYLGTPPPSLLCKEVSSARWASITNDAAQHRALRMGDWDELKQQGLDLYGSFYTDKDGNFEYDMGIPGTVKVPAMNRYGEFLLIAFLNTSTTIHYWEEHVTIRKGEKTQPVVLVDPIVCK